MSIVLLMLITALLLAVSSFFETVGIWFRYLGSLAAQPARGYSFHVRSATFGRMCFIAAAPLFGLLVDITSNARSISSTGGLFFVLHFSFGIFILMNFKRIISLLSQMFGMCSNELITDIHNDLKLFKNLDKHLLILTIFTYMFTASGIIVVNAIAAQFPAYKASVVQSVGFITAFGTFIHVFFIDPKLSDSADAGPSESFSLCTSYYIGRILGSMFGAITVVLFLSL